MLFIALIVIYGVVISFLYNIVASAILVIISIMGLIYTIVMMNEMSTDTNRYISDLSYRIHRGEQESLLEMPIGVMILNENGLVEWTNPYFTRYFNNENILGKRIEDVDHDLQQLMMKYGDSDEFHTVTWRDHKFTMLIQSEYHSIYMLDITRYANLEERYEEEQISVGQIFLDNYDEITQSMTDQEISNLSNYVTNELATWSKKYGMYLKQIDDDHFFLLAYAKSLTQIENDKFNILDIVRESTSKQNFPLTLSIGISYGEDDLNSLADQAQSNLDLALGRGGDQVVVKSLDGTARFYGGKTNPMEKRTRVRARMISQALNELMGDADQIFVQGHTRPDMDSLGACMGIRRIAQMNNKKCWIVLDKEKVHSDIQRLLEAAKKYPEISDAIITPAEALSKVTDSSLLIMVDHSKPSISISPDLYQRMTQKVVIIDHHRRGEEFPENPMLVYIEPYASSTCELITEMFEYQPHEEEPINRIEATAMLTGIFIDTQSFSMRTGTRTFDAASYLRSAGADSVEMQQLMKENIDNYLQRNHLISMVEFFHKDMAMIVGEEDRVYDPVTAAQACDSLLTMSGVDASFIITKRSDDKIGVSARSTGSINVQIIMERMGGGGHLSSGATQIEDKSIAEVKQLLLETIDYIDDNE
ncbi:DHH family phosphoesterase [Lentilactobacillus hilgardii]|uniref:Cyclic-di-AMP phosphodiesterase n=4 Tax=Lactobacillaceae TaxID=33958 RepID=A0A6P1EB12_LENHI|nr:DHHA1 domain protein [Lentilactobacillus hilgardii ATCC 27305]MBZ2201999.1 DHH family phosphoesterase [Lentilactobacillus hilgardii]RRG08996.1 MAG: DHH family phosphoesterase [Lactobacillus sp.]MBZ2204764.1 DHH family phosphoesterase [Lentilactobacillus hilgardii]MCT3392252.1 DHH family phosphoesterase [Lentilactobacillus hilgardii]